MDITTANDIQPPRDRGIKLKDLMAMAGVSKTKIYAMIKTGDLPAPRKFGRASRWSEQAVDQALKSLDPN
jgi:prophage regulatory protein